MNVAKKAKPARPAAKAKKAKPAKTAKRAKRVGGVVVLLMAVLTGAGCALTVNRTPIMSESAGETVVAYATALKTGFGNKEATTLGNYTLSADGGLSISNLSNQNDASLAFVRAVELGASLATAYMGRPGSVSAATDGGWTEGAAVPLAGRPGALNPNAGVEGAAAEARAAGKTLVVVAGHPLCGYCTRFEAALNASGIPARTDVVLLRELNPWESNAAYRWTGGGNAPIVRVTRWDASGGLVCDRKLNRPGVADLTAALDACLVPSQ